MQNTTSAPFSNDSKQRYDEMMARLAAKEAKIAANHERYLAIMAEADRASTPCAWCDGPVPEVDHGQVVYCSEIHARLGGYVPEAEGNV